MDEVHKFRSVGMPSRHDWSYSQPYPSPSLAGFTNLKAGWESARTYNHAPLLKTMREGKQRWDIGGPFMVQKNAVELDPRTWDLLYKPGPNTIFSYRGALIPSAELIPIISRQGTGSWSTENDYVASLMPSVASDTNLGAMGATAIANVSPTNPYVDLSTSIVEILKEGLPALPGGNLGNPGGEYLNHQFGTLPALNDLKDTFHAVRQAGKLLDSYIRNSGRWVRRRYNYPTARSVVKNTYSNRVPYPVPGSMLPGGLSSSGTLTVVDSIEEDIWFSGAFTYRLPDDGILRRLSELDRLLGLQPGIDTVYNSIAWSWLLDYFTNLGSLFENLNDLVEDGLIMPYGYIMSTTKRTREYSLAVNLRIGGSWSPQTITARRYDVVKRRLRATPFGFGLDYDGLSDRQKSILAALGMSWVLSNH